MKRKRKLVLLFIVIAILVELVSAPIEWFWPKDWGGFTYWRGKTKLPEIALTFDDGPSRYTSTLKPGAIIILHDGDDGNPESDRPKSTIELLPMLLEELDKRGFQVVPLNQLLNI